MALDFESLCRDRGIDTAPRGHSHSRKGWTNVECPLCDGSRGFHLGYNHEKDYTYCWRCGWHRKEDVLKALVRGTEAEARRLLKQYQVRGERRSTKDDKEPKTASQGKVLPSGCGPINKRHRQYLEGRGLDPDVVEPLWGLLGTGPVSEKGYAHRIIAPVRFDDQIVSFQGRDITGLSQLRYKACPQEREIIPHQDVLYGLDLVRGEDVVVVEGIADVWKLGAGAVATFGIDYSISQVRLLHPFRRRFIMYDSHEPQAMSKAEELAAELSIFSGEVEIVDLEEDDPAAMKAADARALMRELGMRG